MRTLLSVAAAAAALNLAAGAQAAPSDTTKHDRQVIRFFTNHPELARTPAGVRAMWKVMSHLEQTIRTLQTVRASRVSACYGAKPAACAWYLDGATQCEVAHEGGFKSVSPDGIYAGTFQSDRSFETETPFGNAMEARYGRANNWPPAAQIEHAFEVWSYSGWSRWPPYYKYGCAAYKGGRYSS